MWEGWRNNFATHEIYITMKTGAFSLKNKSTFVLYYTYINNNKQIKCYRKKKANFRKKHALFYFSFFVFTEGGGFSVWKGCCDKRHFSIPTFTPQHRKQTWNHLWSGVHHTSVWCGTNTGFSPCLGGATVWFPLFYNIKKERKKQKQKPWQKKSDESGQSCFFSPGWSSVRDDAAVHEPLPPQPPTTAPSSSSSSSDSPAVNDYKYLFGDVVW